MPANLPPEYHDAEKRYREARTPQEKIEVLEEMLAIIPKHKGTEHLIGDLRRRIAKQKAEAQKKGVRKGFAIYVEKEGAGQVVLVGPPNSGKSTIVGFLTNAKVEVAEYPFATRKPVAGMMPFENIQIQLVDLPPISTEHMEPWVLSLVRPADLVLFIVDLASDSLLEEIVLVEEVLGRARIDLVGAGPTPPPAEPGRVVKKTLLVGNKLDEKGAEEASMILQELYGQRFPILTISALDGAHLEVLRRRIYEGLGIVRVYTKAPGRPPAMSVPVVLPQRSTILDVAESIHKDFAEQLKFARVWGQGKYDGQRVNRDYVVQEGDIIELHI